MRIMKTCLISLVVVLGAAIITAVGFLYLWPEHTATVLIKLERDRSGLERKEISLSDGSQYVYLEGGKGEPLMLLHGFGADKDNFVRVARYLTRHYWVIAPDHIGSGESTHPIDADYSPRAQAERLRTLAHALGITNLHLGGSSMGGHIAMTYAALYPGEVKSLWLIDTGGVWSAPKSELQRIIKSSDENPLTPRNDDEFARMLPFVMSRPPFIPRPILNVMAKQRIANYALEQRVLKQIASDSVEQRVSGLKTPALIVWGKEDRVLNVETAEILHKLLPASRVIIMAGIGHLPMIEDPKRSAEDYLAFRASLKQ